MEQIVTIQLFGRPYTFKAETEGTRASEITDYLVNEVARVEGKHTDQTTDISKLAILISAALNITSEHVELKRNHSMLLGDIAERSAKLIRLLDRKVR